MPAPGFFQLVLARDPRRLARLPEIPIDRALEELRRFQTAPAPSPPPTVENLSTPAPPPAPPAPPAESLGASLSQLATHVWRAKNKMLDPATGQPHDDLRRAYRHVEGAIESLIQMEVTMSDWLHQSYDAGLPLKVVAFQPTPGLTRDTVIEAVRPAVLWKNQLLQLGEVIVGIPESSASPEPLSSAS